MNEMRKYTRKTVAKKDECKDFDTLIKGVPVEVFVRMVSKSGLPANEAKSLCAAFKEMKDA